MEFQAGEEGLGEVGEVAKKGRGGLKSGRNDLKGGDTGGTTIWLGVLGTFAGNGEDGGGDTHCVYEKNHGEAGLAEVRWDVGDYQGRSSTVSGGIPVGNDLHRKKTGDGGTVGGTAADF